MKTIAILLLCVGTLFGECTTNDCKPVDKVKVEMLTQCEKKKLDAAKQAYVDVQNEILHAHGQPSQVQYYGYAYSQINACQYQYRTYELNEDGFVVIKVHDVSSCMGTIVQGNIITQ